MMAASSLRKHMERTHGMILAQTREAGNAVEERDTYVVSFTQVLHSVVHTVEEVTSEGSHTGKTKG